jgi:outer membrane protein assembly factor BamB
VRRVVAVPGGVVGITRDRRAFRLDRDGRHRWRTALPALPHTVAAKPDGSRVLVATNVGAIELDGATGTEIARYDVDGLPVWTGVYLRDGRIVLVTHNGVVVVLRDGQERWRLRLGEYPKRMWVVDGRIYLVGDGGLKEIVVGEGVVRRWSKLLSNTVENAVIVNGRVYACSYGMQVVAYEYASGSCIDLMQDPPEHLKALAVLRTADGTPFLLVGCRGGVLSTYQVDRASGGVAFAQLRDHRLPATVALTTSRKGHPTCA